VRQKIVDAALMWNGQGVNVLPIEFAGKRPLIRWNAWQQGKRTQKPELVKRWFGKDFPRANLGIICSGGLVVLDFDKPGEYIRWINAPEIEWSSYTVRTRRGWHVYVWVDSKPSNIYYMNGGEVRGAGFVVAAPSIHESGFVYKSLNRKPIARVATLNDLGVQYTLPTRSFEGDDRAFLQEDSPDSELGIVARIKRYVSVGEYLNRITNLFWDGQNLMACCPYHDDKNPSMIVHNDEGWTYCFSPSCIAHRRLDVIDLYALRWEISISDAIRMLATEVD
jgi:hypothetical protein